LRILNRYYDKQAEVCLSFYVIGIQILTFYSSNSYYDCFFFEDKSSPEGFRHLSNRQPFITDSRTESSDRLLVNLTLARGQWQQLLSAEQTAYALAQVTPLHVLPPINGLDNGSALLDYRVRLRDRMADDLVEMLTDVLNTQGEDLYWKQIEPCSYACVIYYGVAVCIDTASGEEMLYLRYSNERATAICNASYKTEIPLSLSGLQAVLFERIDELLNSVRLRTLSGLSL
jgi:hypothetical protein